MQPKIDKKHIEIGRMQPIEKDKIASEEGSYMKNLSDNLKKIRKENNLSQEQLAEKLGVSRQSVSKWESNQAYPEMDKMIKLCQLFNLNIDDLLNQDIKEVNTSKQSKININKYVDDFLDFITKTIDMFGSMKFKSKVKCLFEQMILIGIIFLVFLVCGFILENIYESLFYFLSNSLYHGIYRVLSSIYLLQCLILGTILVLHIFKIRYLDYYVIVREDKIVEYEEKSETKKLEKKESDNKIIIEKPREKIIIRDSKHSGYSIISGLLKCLLFIIKAICLLIACMFCASLILLIILFVISFIFVKTGMLFIGTILLLLSIITINILILILLYNFILSRKTKKDKLAISFILSIILIGVGIGLISISLTNFDVISINDSKNFVKKEVVIEMEEHLFIEDYMDNITYIESNNGNIRIEYTYHPSFDIELVKTSTGLYISHFIDEQNMNELLRNLIEDINNKKVVDYSNFEVKIYTTKENIQKLNNNLKLYLDKKYEIERQQLIDEYEKTINELEEKLENKDNKIFELEEELNTIETECNF